MINRYEGGMPWGPSSHDPRSGDRRRRLDGYCTMGTGVSGVLWVCACVRVCVKATA